MIKGYQVFGNEYKIMLENDLHDSKSIDHQFLREMILLQEDTYDLLYSNITHYDMHDHELFSFAQQFKGIDDKQTIANILKFTSNISQNYDVDFKDMLFGGTEQQIIERGTNWCADMARVGAVLLQCCNIPCRIIHLANINRAYNGHVVCEAFYENNYGVIDFIYGYQFYTDKPNSAFDLWTNPKLLKNYSDEYRGYYSAIAINEYNPTDKNNIYAISTPNRYYLNLIYTEHGDDWFMGENKALHLLKK